MRVRTWKYPANLWGSHWSRFVRTGEPAVSIGYLSVDRDGALEVPGPTPGYAFVRKSSGGHGLHLRVPLRGLRLSPFQAFQVRQLLQDDPLRLKMDAYRWKRTRDPLYLRGITFDRKNGRRAGPWVRAAAWRLRTANRILPPAARQIAPGPTWRSLHLLNRGKQRTRIARRVIAGKRSHLRQLSASPARPNFLP
jgi:hypothetical protein